VKQWAVLGVLIALIVSLACGQIWLAHIRLDNAQQRHLVQQQIEQEERSIARLSLEYANLTSPQHLRQWAHDSLGMRAPRPEQLIAPKP